VRNKPYRCANISFANALEALFMGNFWIARHPTGTGANDARDRLKARLEN
jgi:hypothetical protein